ncbi:DUF6265 family protein [Shewanella submarina]|uniref:DUF6265 family protein n=1 Tax=Shewanella submarina TaxID=2016376 RepID=A0ABV7GBM3_9GAMM|nr:DUF6265 family protein [Shewanella submarina]MCL1036968.1 DUF6265 family protein [Shewanella submarina]
MFKPGVWFVAIGLLLTGNVSADTPNLVYLKPGQSSPAADLRAVAWLAGHWQGTALGGDVEEVWSPPLGDSMMGAFKLTKQGKTQFYELETIVQEEGSLVFRLKHFGPQLVGWEAKEQSVAYPLVRVTDNRVYFSGLTLERHDDQRISVYVAHKKEGETSELVFNYHRVESVRPDANLEVITPVK